MKLTIADITNAWLKYRDHYPLDKPNVLINYTWGIGSGSQNSQERNAQILSATQGDHDGWVSWVDKPPPTDVEVECKCDGETYRVIPRQQSSWKVNGVYWRALERTKS